MSNSNFSRGLRGWPRYVFLCRSYRLRAGLTQSGLAAMLGITQGAIAKWETGRARPTPLHCIALVETTMSRCSLSGPSRGVHRQKLLDELLGAVAESTLSYSRRRIAAERLGVDYDSI